MNTTRRSLTQDELYDRITALAIGDEELIACVRAVFTRQTPGKWVFLMGQCQMGGDEVRTTTEIYRNIAFISQTLDGWSIKKLLLAMAANGLQVHPDLPPLQLPQTPLGWTEDLVPSYATGTGAPARRFTVNIAREATFSEGQLIDFKLPYRPSATRCVGEFLGLNYFHGSSDGQKGEFSIAVSRPGGAISFAEGRLRIVNRNTDLRLVGEINRASIDVRNDTAVEIDGTDIRDAELWLLNKDNDVVDYISTTSWPYKFENTPDQLEEEERLLKLIAAGESETCEFKPYIDLSNTKAADIEKAVCAFSNQRGGMLFIGINDDGDIVGVAKGVAKRGEDIDNAVANYEKEIRTRLRETLKNNQCFTSQVVTVRGTDIVVVEVEQSPEINFLVKSDQAKIAYIRHGATSARMSPPEVKTMIEGELTRVSDERRSLWNTHR